MGFLLTEPDVIRDMPIGEPTLHDVVGHDLMYGWRLYEAGHVLAHDWSVGCRHWHWGGSEERKRLQLA